MKKFAIMAVAICAAFIMAAPAMAIDADFSGYYNVRGFYDSHYGLRDSDASSAYMDMELELNTVFKVSDNLSLTTKIMGLSGKKWGDSDDTTASTLPGVAAGVAVPAHTHDITSDLDLDHVYMTIKTGFGKFVIGRMAAGVFGTSFMDNEYEADRIVFKKAIDNLHLGAVIQKNAENDAGLDVSDQDTDVYWLFGKYKTEDIAAGLMYGFVNDKINSGLAVVPGPTGARTYKGHILDPYITAKFGPLALQAELVYMFGDTEYDDATTADLDKKELAYNLEATYDLEMASVQAGYAFFSGDVTDDNDDKSFGGWGGADADRLWEKLFILTTDENVYLAYGLGGAGNLSRYHDVGAKIYYAGVDVTPMENLKLGFIVGLAEADKVDTGVEDDIGIEYDLTLNWKIYDNLTYSAIAAYLDAGDIWKDDPTTQIENTYALFHQLELTF